MTKTKRQINYGKVKSLPDSTVDSQFTQPLDFELQNGLSNSNLIQSNSKNNSNLDAEVTFFQTGRQIKNTDTEFITISKKSLSNGIAALGDFENAKFDKIISSAKNAQKPRKFNAPRIRKKADIDIDPLDAVFYDVPIFVPEI